MAMDIFPAFEALGGVKQAILLMAFGVIGVIGFTMAAVMIINRSLIFPIKFDFKNRHTGFIKRVPYRAQIFLKREGGGAWVNDKWGYTLLNNERVAVLKKANHTFNAPKFKDIHPGNLLILFSPNYGEVYPLTIDENTLEMKANVDYNAAGHVFACYRAHAQKFARPGNWEKWAPIFVFGASIILSFLLVFLVINMLLERMDLLVGAFQGAANNMASACEGTPPPPPPV